VHLFLDNVSKWWTYSQRWAQQWNTYPVSINRQNESSTIFHRSII